MKISYILSVSLLLLLITGCGINTSDSQEKIKVLEQQLAQSKEEITNLKNTVDKQTTALKALKGQIDTSGTKKSLGDSKMNSEQGDYYIGYTRLTETTLDYTIKKKTEPSQVVNIIGERSEAQYDYYNMSTLRIPSSPSGELLKVVVSGTIYDFKLAEVTWDENLSPTIKKIKYRSDEVTNKEITIDTILSESLPFEMLFWKDHQGQDYQVPISYDGIGHSGTIILSNLSILR